MVKVKTVRPLSRSTPHLIYHTLPEGTEVEVMAKTNKGTYMVNHKNGVYLAQLSDLEPFDDPFGKPVPTAPHGDDLGVLPPVNRDSKANALLSQFQKDES